MPLSVPPAGSAPPPAIPPKPSPAVIPRVPPRIAALPRFPLLDGPSPLRPLPRFSAELGGRAEIWMKREDLLPIGFGGNKLRNLEFLVGAALAEGCDTLITSGRRWSNHCRLTAAAGARAGLAVHVVVSGPPSEIVGSVGPMLDELFGATVHVAPSAAREDREAMVEAVRAEVAGGGRPYVIGVGGSGRTGYAGQVLAGLEVAAQLGLPGVVAASVVVPSATGGTQAGVLAGLRVAGIGSTSVVGVAAAHPADVLRAAVLGALGEIEILTGVAVDPGEVVVDGGQLGEGYGVPSAAADEATHLLARSEGILVDPIYTAKGLAGLVAGVREGRWDDSAVVFWHAGGLPGLFERLERPEPPA